MKIEEKAPSMPTPSLFSIFYFLFSIFQNG